MRSAWPARGGGSLGTGAQVGHAAGPVAPVAARGPPWRGTCKGHERHEARGPALTFEKWRCSVFVFHWPSSSTRQRSRAAAAKLHVLRATFGTESKQCWSRMWGSSAMTAAAVGCEQHTFGINNESKSGQRDRGAGRGAWAERRVGVKPEWIPTT